MKVEYTHVESDGRLSFCAPDGSDVTVGGKGTSFQTDDPNLVAYLDASPFVKRVGKTAAKDASG